MLIGLFDLKHRTVCATSLLFPIVSGSHWVQVFLVFSLVVSVFIALFPGYTVTCCCDFIVHAISSQVHVYVRVMLIFLSYCFVFVHFWNKPHLGSELRLDLSRYDLCCVHKQTVSYSHGYQIFFCSPAVSHQTQCHLTYALHYFFVTS